MTAPPVVASFIVNDLLNSRDDYAGWRHRVQTYLVAEGLWSIVSDDERRPRGNDKREAWDKIDAKALHVINICCGRDAFPTISDKYTSRKAWKALEKKFGDTDAEVEGTDQVESDLENDGAEGDAIATDVNYSNLYDALRVRNVKAILEFIEENQDAVTARCRSNGKTALHVAVNEQDLEAVKKLLELMKEDDLEIGDEKGLTSLHYCCLTAKGYTPQLLDIAKCLVAKNKKLLSIADSTTNQIPLLLAFEKGHLENLVEYLFRETPLEDQDNRQQAAEFISRSLLTKRLDRAWDLIQRKPSLGIVENTTEGCCPLSDLACLTSAFLSGEKLKFWEKWIYRRIQIEDSLTINNGEPIRDGNDAVDVYVDAQGSSPPADQVNCGHSSNLWKKYLIPTIKHRYKYFGIARIYDMKQFHVRCDEFLTCMSRELKEMDEFSKPKKKTTFVQVSIFKAVERGLVEFLTRLFTVNPRLGQLKDEKYKHLFQYAVECRQAKVLDLMTGFNTDSKEVFMSNRDDDGNNMVHMAGLFTTFAQTNHIRGAGLQMQKELQWFKKLASMASPEDLEATNDTEDKPRELFTKTHIELMKEGEKSMKDTATSCTVVGALMVTVMFAAAFTVPGGYKSDTGTPILLGEIAFKFFIVSDAISLFTSTTSVMLFLGILTARYAEDDFLYSLPKRMVLGLFSVFLSVSAMMVAFASALFLILPHENWIPISTSILTGIPVASFMWMQFPFLIEILKSTYRPKIFVNKKIVPFEE